MTHAGSVLAGGLYLQEFATPSMGVASAGAEAICRDASTSWHNPAGMTRLEGNEFMLAAGLAKSNIEFDSDSPGGDGGNAGGYAPLGAAFYTRSLSEDWKLGASLIAISGALLDYDDDWVGRYECQETSILIVTLTPSIAYRINDQWSISGGVNLMYGELELDAAIPQSGLPDGQASLDGDDFDVGFSLSALFEPSKQTRIGVIYWSKLEPSFSGDLSIKPVGLSIGTDLEMTFPQFVRVGIYHELDDKWALLGTVAWEDWSELDNLFLSTTTGGTADIPRNWDDTWHFAAGVRYRINERWLVEGGIAHDTSPVDSVDRTADMPVDKQFRLSLGVEQNRSDKVTLGLIFQYTDLGDSKIKSYYTGDYEKNEVFSLAFNVNWK
ncbi:MAG: outer membrane protein transport protein [Thermodesulfobacteriota bacterium]|nr:outer membrane protein transport protein [Thermodesulfobacteriota bacterium]